MTLAASSTVTDNVPGSSEPAAIAFVTVAPSPTMPKTAVAAFGQGGRVSYTITVGSAGSGSTDG